MCYAYQVSFTTITKGLSCYSKLFFVQKYPLKYTYTVGIHYFINNQSKSIKLILIHIANFHNSSLHHPPESYRRRGQYTHDWILV